MVFLRLVLIGVMLTCCGNGCLLLLAFVCIWFCGLRVVAIDGVFGFVIWVLVMFLYDFGFTFCGCVLDCLLVIALVCFLL